MTPQTQNLSLHKKTSTKNLQQRILFLKIAYEVVRHMRAHKSMTVSSIQSIAYQKSVSNLQKKNLKFTDVLFIDLFSGDGVINVEMKLF